MILDKGVRGALSGLAAHVGQVHRMGHTDTANPRNVDFRPRSAHASVANFTRHIIGTGMGRH